MTTETPLRWRIHPARERPHHMALLVAICLFSAYAVLWSLHSAFLTVLAVAILLVATAPFWLPTEYVLSDEGVSERRAGHTRFRAWADIRRIVIGTDAALLSPFAARHRMERYRGIVVVFAPASGIDQKRAAMAAQWLRDRQHAMQQTAPDAASPTPDSSVSSTSTSHGTTAHVR